MEGFAETQLICRACLKVVEVGTQSYGYVEDATGNLRDMLFCCIPEMDIYISLNPIVCIQCINALINIYQFKSRCLNTESIISTYLKKNNLSDQNPINLSDVVQDLIKINNVLRLQEQIRRRNVIEQQKNNLEPPVAPSMRFVGPQNRLNLQMPVRQNNFLHRVPPLHFLKGSHENLTNVPTVREYPQMQQPNFIGPRPPMAFIPHNFPHNLGPSYHIRHSGPMPYMRPLPPTHPLMLMPRMGHSRISNGVSLPVQPKDVPIQQNIVHYLNTPKDPTIFTSNDTSTKLDKNTASPINNTELDNNTTINNNTSVEMENTSTRIDNRKITYHPIESKLRLVIKIPRHKITLPFIDKKPVDTEDHQMDHSNDETEDLPMSDVIDSLLEGDDNIPEDYPEYLPEDGKVDINEIYNKGEDTSQHKNITKLYNCSCMYLTTSETLFEGHKKLCKNSGKKNMVKCPHCPHITNRAYALNKHINTMHTKAFWFHCDSCSYRSTDKSCLRRHVRKNHEESLESEPNKQYCCHICNMMISTEYNYQRHLLKHDESHLTHYECDFCSYNSKDRSNYRKHVFTHSPIQLQCPNCPYSNVSPYQLRTHIKRFHDGAGMEAADCKSDIPITEIISDIKQLLDSIEGKQGNECS